MSLLRPPYFASSFGKSSWSLVSLGWGGALERAASVRIGLGETCDMDPVQLALTSALLWLGKAAAAEEPEREEEAAQDPLGLKQSVFIATPIVVVRK